MKGHGTPPPLGVGAIFVHVSKATTCVWEKNLATAAAARALRSAEKPCGKQEMFVRWGWRVSQSTASPRCQLSCLLQEAPPKQVGVWVCTVSDVPKLAFQSEHR